MAVSCCWDGQWWWCLVQSGLSGMVIEETRVRSQQWINRKDGEVLGRGGIAREQEKEGSNERSIWTGSTEESGRGRDQAARQQTSNTLHYLIERELN